MSSGGPVGSHPKEMEKKMMSRVMLLVFSGLSKICLIGNHACKKKDHTGKRSFQSAEHISFDFCGSVIKFTFFKVLERTPPGEP